MYKTLHGQIPRYLSGDCQLICDASRRLRSSDTFTFAVPLRLVDKYARFRRHLKGHVWLRLRRLVTLFLGAVYKYTYSLTHMAGVAGETLLALQCASTVRQPCDLLIS